MPADERVKAILQVQELLASLEGIPLYAGEITVMAGARNRASYYAWKGGRSVPENRVVIRLQYVLDTSLYLTNMVNGQGRSGMLRDYFISPHRALGGKTPIEFIREHGNTKPDLVLYSIREFVHS